MTLTTIRATTGRAHDLRRLAVAVAAVAALLAATADAGQAEGARDLARLAASGRAIDLGAGFAVADLATIFARGTTPGFGPEAAPVGERRASAIDADAPSTLLRDDDARRESEMVSTSGRIASGTAPETARSRETDASEPFADAPEPATVALLFAGLAALVSAIRRRHRPLPPRRDAQAEPVTG